MDEADDMEALLIPEGRQMSVYQSRKTSAPGWTRLRLAEESAATKVLKELAEREELSHCIGARFLGGMELREGGHADRMPLIPPKRKLIRFCRSRRCV